jgi:hypothetical protein
MMPIKKKPTIRPNVPTPTKTLTGCKAPSFKAAIPPKITKPMTQTVRVSWKKKSDDFMFHSSIACEEPGRN